MQTRFTCVDAVQETSHHDHLEGHGSAAEDHQHGACHGHQIVQQEAAFPAGGVRNVRVEGVPRKCSAVFSCRLMLCNQLAAQVSQTLQTLPYRQSADQRLKVLTLPNRQSDANE